ncbi:MAG: AAA domain-containing protein [Candidatus Latescibacteria bacterium]|nr:AAA domain-containing protein [Candidatus Latescibacterota bacterium]
MARSVDWAEFLRFEQEQGQIFLRDYRMVLLSAYALGALRRELIETVGWDRARGLLKRFGYAAGLADSLALKDQLPDSTTAALLEYGPQLHALEGVVKTVQMSAGADAAQEGAYLVEGFWENSYEAEQHLALFGPSQVPVCWTLAGYASGHATAVSGEKTYLIETGCRAMGHERCSYIADSEQQLARQYPREKGDYQASHLPQVLDDLSATIARQQRQLRHKDRTIVQLQAQLGPSQEGLVGESRAWRQAIELARRVAPVDSTVLLLGESGTGKELVARDIQRHSRRADGPMVPVNCSTLPETLQEAELFGYAKGAFTGATAASPGLFASADGGTLFLDEIGDLTLQAQTKLLRALQEGEIKPIGEAQARRVDVRFIAATHRDLEAMVAAGSFRQDLFFRLNVISLELPPLRQRDNDALLLAEYFAAHFAAKFDKKVKRLSALAKRALAAYAWPGNVRELEHALERAVILADGPLIDLIDLPPKIGQTFDPEALDKMRERAQQEEQMRLFQAELAQWTTEKERLQKALEFAAGNRLQAAAMLGMSRTTLWRKLKKWGLE